MSTRQSSEDLPPTRIKPAFYENTGFMRSAPAAVSLRSEDARATHKPRQPALIHKLGVTSEWRLVKT